VFYERKREAALRFGDVVCGFVLSTPRLDDPILNSDQLDCDLAISLPPFCAILSPCCSIRDKVLSLAPLKPVIGTFFGNPYFVDDLTNINRKMPPEVTMPPHAWDKLCEQERERRRREGSGYAFVGLFIYERNDLLPEHEVHTRKGPVRTGYYMIDFRDTFKVSCSKVIGPKQSPVEAKWLQLSLTARQELRDKIAFYYSRVPQEDTARLQQL